MPKEEYVMLQTIMKVLLMLVLMLMHAENRDQLLIRCCHRPLVRWSPMAARHSSEGARVVKDWRDRTRTSMPTRPSNPDQNAFVMRKKFFLTAAIAVRSRSTAQGAATGGLPRDSCFRENSHESPRRERTTAAPSSAREPC